MPTKKAIKSKKEPKKTVATKPAKKILRVVKKQSLKKTAARKAGAGKTVAANMHHSKKKKFNPKRIIYMTLAIILGITLSVFFQAFMEMIYLKKSLRGGEGLVGNTTIFGTTSYLPALASVLFFLSGIAFGVWLGFWGWKAVYEDGTRDTYRC